MLLSALFLPIIKGEKILKEDYENVSSQQFLRSPSLLSVPMRIVLVTTLVTRSSSTGNFHRE